MINHQADYYPQLQSRLQVRPRRVHVPRLPQEPEGVKSGSSCHVLCRLCSHVSYRSSLSWSRSSAMCIVPVKLKSHSAMHLVSCPMTVWELLR